MANTAAYVNADLLLGDVIMVPPPLSPTSCDLGPHQYLLETTRRWTRLTLA